MRFCKGTAVAAAICVAMFATSALAATGEERPVQEPCDKLDPCCMPGQCFPPLHLTLVLKRHGSHNTTRVVLTPLAPCFAAKHTWKTESGDKFAVMKPSELAACLELLTVTRPVAERTLDALIECVLSASERLYRLCLL